MEHPGLRETHSEHWRRPCGLAAAVVWPLPHLDVAHIVPPFHISWRGAGVLCKPLLPSPCFPSPLYPLLSPPSPPSSSLCVPSPFSSPLLLSPLLLPLLSFPLLPSVSLSTSFFFLLSPPLSSTLFSSLSSLFLLLASGPQIGGSLSSSPSLGLLPPRQWRLMGP